MEDVGLRARIADIGNYERDARRVQDGMRDIATSAKHSADQVNSHTQSIVGSLKGVIAAAAGIVAIKIGTDAFRGAIMSASDLNETMNKVDVVFGQAADSIKEFAKDSARSLGMSKNEALGAASGFGNLFTTMGSGQAEAAEMSKGIVKLAADLASFHNIRPEDALQKLRSGLVGETEPLRQVGILLDEDTVKTFAYTKGIAAQGAELTQQQKVLARYQLILSQSGNAQGDFANTSTGVANSLRIMQAGIANLSAEIGERFLPIIAPLISGLAQSLPNVFDAIQPAVDGFADAMRRALDIARGALGIGRAIRDALSEGDIGAAFRIIGGTFDTWVRPAIDNMIAELGNNIGRVWNWIQEEGPNWLAELGGWTENFVKWAPKALEAGVKGLADNANKLWSWVTTNAPIWGTNLQRWTAEFAAWGNKLWSNLEPSLQQFGKDLQAWIQANGPTIRKALETWTAEFRDWIPKATEAIISQQATVNKANQDLAREAGAVLGKNLGEEAGKAAASLITGLVEGEKKGEADVLAAAQRLVQLILLPFIALPQAAWAFGQAFASNLAAGLNSQAAAVGAAADRLRAAVAASVPQPLKGLVAPPSGPRLIEGFVGPIATPEPSAAGERAFWEDMERDARKYQESVEDVGKETQAAIDGISSAGEREFWADLERDAQNYGQAAVTAGAAGAGGIEQITKAGGGAAAATKKNKEEMEALKLAAQEAKWELEDMAASIRAAMEEAAATSKAALQELEEAARQVELALREVEAALRDLASPRFAGQQAAEDELFALEQAAKRARLAELRAGEGGKEAAKKIKEAAEANKASFDILAAQQRELATGVPVAVQRAEWERQQAQQRVQPAAKPAAQRGPAEREKTPTQIERERIERELQIKRLEFELEFEPQSRQAKRFYNQITGKEKPEFASLEEYEQAVIEAAGQAETLKIELEQSKRAEKELKAEAIRTKEEFEAQLDAVKEDLKTLNRLLDTEGVNAEIVLGFMEEVRARRAETLDVEREIGAAEEAQVEIGAAVLDIAEKIAGARWSELEAIKQINNALSQRPASPPASNVPGMATGGEALTAGTVRVGERGSELMSVPAGTRVMPAGTGAAIVNRNSTDNWNITSGANPIDVADQVRRWLAFKRITEGR